MLRKQQKSQKMVLLRSTVTFASVLRSNTIFCDFCCFLSMIKN